MKWFNPERYHGAAVSDEVIDSTISDYWRHAAQIRDWLPADLQQFAVPDTRLSLHDGYIERLISRPGGHSYTLIVMAGYPHVGFRRITFHYTGAELVTDDLAHLRGMLDAVAPYRRAGTEAVVYLPLICILEDELDVLEPGAFEHRFRMHHHVYFSIRFTNCHVSVEERADRTLSNHLKRAIL